MSLPGAYGLNFPTNFSGYKFGGTNYIKNFAKKISARFDTPEMKMEREALKGLEQKTKEYGIQSRSPLGSYIAKRNGIFDYGLEDSGLIRASGGHKSAAREGAETAVGIGILVIGGLAAGWVLFSDFDHDGLSNSEEWWKYDTSPFQTDSDGDGKWDGEEVYRGTDPRFERPPGYQDDSDFDGDDSNGRSTYPPRDDNGKIPVEDCSDGWRIAGYYTPIEDDYDNSRRQISVDGMVRSYDSRFLEDVMDEGWGKTRFDEYLRWDGDEFHFSRIPRDAEGHPLNIGDAATDRSMIEEHTKFTVPDLPGSWGDITYKAMDVRDDVEGREVAIYTGEGEIAGDEASEVRQRDATVCVIDG
jgi:hypothetical protein